MSDVKRIVDIYKPYGLFTPTIAITNWVLHEGVLYQFLRLLLRFQYIQGFPIYSKAALYQLCSCNGNGLFVIHNVINVIHNAKL